MRKIVYLSVLAAGLLAVAPASVRAVEAVDLLPDRIVEPEPDAPVLDTALVFTNVSNVPVTAKFEAVDDQGVHVSSGQVDIAANGLVYVLASRLANEAGLEGFVGHVEAKVSGHVIGSTVLLGAVVSDIDTINVVRRVRPRPSADAADGSIVPRVHSRITFPVVATR